MNIGKKLKNIIAGKYISLTYERRCRLYCVGAAKTGTHSIGSLFNQSVRSAHEAESAEFISTILDISQGLLNKEDISTYIKNRDKKICLDIDSSQLNFFIINYLVNEFPDALFLLTIRDCYSWLDSFINDSLRRTTSKNWVRLREQRFRSDVFSHPPEELFLKERGLYTLDGYLSYWTNHNNKVLTSVPANRLMVIKTNEITHRAYELADFAGIPRAAVKIENSHSFKNPTKFNVLQEIDQNYLEEKVQEHCSVLMQRFFPEIKTVHDGLGL